MIRLSEFMHRAWQCLPYDERRQLLFTATAMTAAKLQAATQAQEPIFIAGLLRAATGLGECARIFHDAYKGLGARVYGIDLSKTFRQDSAVADFRFIDGSGHRGPGTLMLHIGAPFVPLALTKLGRAFLRDKWRIGYWAWELPTLPKDWHRGAHYVNEIWAISGFSAATFEASLKRKARVVLPPVMPRRVERDGALYYRQKTGAEFVVLVGFNMASSFVRKNPLAAIAAFKVAFGHDKNVLLIVKMANGHTFPPGVLAIDEACRGYDNIVIVSETLSDQALIDLVAGADVLVSLHRSEGFGLLLAHAMHCGRPIVATNWSGNIEFLNSHNACLVPIELVAVKDPQRTYAHSEASWAEPSIDAAAQHLRRLREDRTFAAALGRRAREDAMQCFAPSKVPRFATPRERLSARSTTQSGHD